MGPDRDGLVAAVPLLLDSSQIFPKMKAGIARESTQAFNAGLRFLLITADNQQVSEKLLGKTVHPALPPGSHQPRLAGALRQNY